jgi:hypothetical protein
MTDYEVKVKTGNVKSGGTDANVYITIHGSKGNSSRLLLDNNANNFEKGDIDTFPLTLADLGELKTITIEHDNTGHKPGWYLEWVQITEMDKKPKVWNFPWNGWLAKDEGDKLIKRDLEGVKVK